MREVYVCDYCRQLVHETVRYYEAWKGCELEFCVCFECARSLPPAQLTKKVLCNPYLKKLRKSLRHNIPWRIDGTVAEYKWRRPAEPVPEIPERSPEDIFWVHHFNSRAYTTYQVLIDAPDGGWHIVEDFRYSDKEWMYNQTRALKQAIYFCDRYNEDVKAWVAKRVLLAQSLAKQAASPASQQQACEHRQIDR